MAGYTYTAAGMVAMARQRADMVGSNFVTDAEITTSLEKYLKRLWMHLVSKHDDLFLSVSTTTVNPGYDTVNPTAYGEYWALRDIQIRDASGNYSRLRRVSITDLERVASRTARGTPQFYCPVHNWWQTTAPPVIARVRPYADIAYTLQIICVVRPPALVDLVTGGGGVGTALENTPYHTMFVDYIVAGAALEMRDKEESDTSTLERDLARFEEEIHRCFPSHDENEPSRVVMHGGEYLDEAAELAGLTWTY